jgi:NitT/TauT family transport system ATP-binding protein
MSVRDNIGFPLAARYQTPASVYSTVENLVERYNVPINLDAYPAKQSIGQRQMCALLQVLMQEPTHILMDEPLASLDPESKWKMLSAISDYVRAKSCTCMIVLHDVDDALLAAHNVIVLSRRPGQLAHSFSVDFDYPRSAHLSTTQPFLSLRSSVLKALLQEVQA